jgi:hypothetical protein
VSAAFVQRIQPVLEQRFLISAAVIIIAGVYDFAVTFCHPAIDKELLTVIMTALNANGIVIVISYWLGSSRGSNEKDATIANLSKPGGA